MNRIVYDLDNLSADDLSVLLVIFKSQEVFDTYEEKEWKL